MARRHADDEEESPLEPTASSHTKWVVGVVSAAIVAALSWLITENYGQAQLRMHAIEQRNDAVAVRVYAHDAQLAEIRANQQNLSLIHI